MTRTERLWSVLPGTWCFWPSPLPCYWWGVGCNWYCWCVTSLPEHSERFAQLASFTLSHLFINALFLCSSALQLTFTHIHTTVDALECQLWLVFCPWISGMQTGYLKCSCRLKSTVSSLVFSAFSCYRFSSPPAGSPLLFRPTTVVSKWWLVVDLAQQSWVFRETQCSGRWCWRDFLPKETNWGLSVRKSSSQLHIGVPMPRETSLFTKFCGTMVLKELKSTNTIRTCVSFRCARLWCNTEERRLLCGDLACMQTVVGEMQEGGTKVILYQSLKTLHHNGS